MKKQKSSRAPAHKATDTPKYVMGIFPKTEQAWISLADDLIAWAHLETSFAIEDFPLSRLYSPHKFYKWMKHNEYFADALEFARYMIGSRRERAARERRVDSSIILKTMPLYNYEFKELMMEKINKHHESQQPKIITVILPQVEDTGVVPIKKTAIHEIAVTK
jgi:hypothetical protein